MVEVKIEAIRVALIGAHRVVLLKDVDSERYLNIWIGQPEAESISIPLTDTPVARPLTHDLILSIISEFGASVQHVVINDMQNETYFAKIVLNTRASGELIIDSRPSDAIAIAVRAKCSIFVEDAIMEEHGQEPEDSGTAGASADEDLGAFNDFLGSLDLDDLGRK
jgi:bifunctional DNase/RNase